MGIRIRSGLAEFKPYSPGALGSIPLETHRLAANENLHGPSPDALTAASEVLQRSHLYPDPFSNSVCEALAKYYGVQKDWFLVAPGSDSIIRMAANIMIGSPEDEILFADPSFVTYGELETLYGGRAVRVPLDYTNTHDIEGMLAAISGKTRLAFIANPNNPTGTTVDFRRLLRFAGALPSDALLVIDEAYYEYAEVDSGHCDGFRIADRFDNVLCLRTFSKAFGLAGLRCGYAYGSPELIRALRTVLPAFSVGCPAQAAAIASLRAPKHMRAAVDYNRRMLPLYTNQLERLGARCSESKANFVYAEFDYPTQEVSSKLAESGVLVRDGSVFGRPNAMRVTVGTEVHLEALIKAFEGCGVRSVSP